MILQVKSLADMGAPAQKKMPRSMIAAADASLLPPEPDPDEDPVP